MEELSVTVVVPTYNRCEDCKRAVASALEQDPPPLEVLVCDDGSTDDTQIAFEAWQATDPRVRYLRIEPNRGTPAPARNLGVSEARGDWVAFLDDDDSWLPGKLALQARLLAEDESDVIATDATRSSGGLYFGQDGTDSDSQSRSGSHGQGEPGFGRLSRVEIERANPVILSSALVRGRLLRDARGFDEGPEIAGVEDYELWLRLAERGARFIVLDAPTVEYRDHGNARLSSATLTTQRALLRVRLRRLRRAPTDRLVLASALREIYATAAVMTRSRREKPV